MYRFKLFHWGSAMCYFTCSASYNARILYEKLYPSDRMQRDAAATGCNATPWRQTAAQHRSEKLQCNSAKLEEESKGHP